MNSTGKFEFRLLSNDGTIKGFAFVDSIEVIETEGEEADEIRFKTGDSQISFYIDYMERHITEERFRFHGPDNAVLDLNFGIED